MRLVVFGAGYVGLVTGTGLSDLGHDVLLYDIDPEKIAKLDIGVNGGIGEPTGDATVDQNRPGLHLVFGDPMPKLTGATWSARTSFAACQARCTVRVDGAMIADDGVLTPA